jgi:hypothetical protein
LTENRTGQGISGMRRQDGLRFAGGFPIESRCSGPIAIMGWNSCVSKTHLNLVVMQRTMPANATTLMVSN